MLDPPVHSPYETLKDFQQTFAAAIALTAAGIAYFGVTARIRFDRRAAAQEKAQKKLALYLRFRWEISVIAALADNMNGRIDGIYKEIKATNQDQAAIAKLLSQRGYSTLRTTPEIDEAWQNLHLFPATIVEDLQAMRRRLILLVHTAETSGVYVNVERLAKSFNEVHEIGNKMIKELDAMISSIRQQIGE